MSDEPDINLQPAADEPSKTQQTSDDIVRQAGFTIADAEPKFSELRMPDNLNYLRLMKEHDSNVKKEQDEVESELRQVLKESGATQKVADHISGWLFRRADEKSRQAHHDQQTKFEYEKIKQEKENILRRQKDSEEYLSQLKETDRRVSLEKTQEYAKAKRYLEYLKGKGDNTIEDEDLYNPKILKILSMTTDLHTWKDKRFLAKEVPPEELSNLKSKFRREQIESLRKLRGGI